MSYPLAQCLLLAGLISTSTCYAFQPLITDDTGTQGAGGNQLEATWEHHQEQEAGVALRSDTVPLVYTHGLTDALDVAVGVPWVRSNLSGNSESGSGNPSLAVKWRFFEQEKGWSFALKPEIAFPVSARNESNGLGDHGTGYSLSLLVSRETTFGEFHVNLGARRYQDDSAGDDSNTYHLSMAPVWKLSDALKLALDVGLEHDNTADESSHYVLLGMVYSPNDSLDLSAGAQKTYSLRGVENPWSASLGLTWHIK